jgi:hypothetical protein
MPYLRFAWLPDAHLYGQERLIVRVSLQSPLFIGLAALLLGVPGCNHDKPAVVKPRPVTDNPLNMPAAEYDKIKNMSPQQREMIEKQLQKSQQAHPGQ